MKNYDKNSVQKEYAQLAQKYDDKWRFYVEATLQETLKKIELHPGESLLDIGCGTGVFLESLEKKYPDAILSGVDPTQEMLDIARKRLSKKVHIEQSWAEKLPFEAENFDLIVSCNMFHYIREPMVALKEIMRVLKPGGKVVITDWCDDYVICKVCNFWFQNFNKAHFKTYKKKECYEFLLLSGFNDIKINSYKINWFWGMMTATASKKRSTYFCNDDSVAG